MLPTLKLDENDMPSHCCRASGLEGNLLGVRLGLGLGLGIG
jgi:hypothetical protein